MSYQKQVDEASNQYNYKPSTSYETKFAYSDQPKYIETKNEPYANNYPYGHNYSDPYKQPNAPFQETKITGFEPSKEYKTSTYQQYTYPDPYKQPNISFQETKITGYEQSHENKIGNFPQYNNYDPYKQPNVSFQESKIKGYGQFPDSNATNTNQGKPSEFELPNVSNNDFPKVSETENPNQVESNNQNPRPFLKRGVSISAPKIRTSFIRKIYCVLSFQALIVSAINFWYYADNELAYWTVSNDWIGVFPFIVFIPAFICSACFPEQIRHTFYVHLIFLIQTISWGFFLGVCGPSLRFSSGVLFIFWGTVLYAGVTISLTLYAFLTEGKIDLYGAIPAIFVCIFIFILGIVLDFLNVWLNLILTMCALIHAVLLIVDTDQILNNHKFQYEADEYVFAALNIFNDILGLIMQGMGKKR